jgi:predicted nucleotidyltransferase
MKDAAARGIIEAVAVKAAGLRLLVLFGSRARGDATRGSDWDLGYIASADFDVFGFLATLVRALGTDRIDLVDLERASGLIRFRAARDGIVLFEATPRAFEEFWFEAVSFWCDMAPVIRAGYEDILSGLER